MTRRLLKIYTQVQTRPYRTALKYVDLDDGKEIVEVYRSWSYGDFAARVLQVLLKEDPEFLRKAAAIDDDRFMANPRKTRRYIAERQDLLYINSPHLTTNFSRKVGEFWMVTNIGQSEALAIASIVAAAAGVERLPISRLQF